MERRRPGGRCCLGTGGSGRMSACTAETWETAPTTRSGGPSMTPEEPEEQHGVKENIFYELFLKQNTYAIHHGLSCIVFTKCHTCNVSELYRSM